MGALANTLGLRDSGLLVPTVLAVLYSVVAHAAGVTLICRAAGGAGGAGAAAAAALGGVTLAAHGRVVAAYMVHEAAHSSIFKRPKANEVVGTLCLWICGAPYANFNHVRKLHIAHHHDRADTVDFDYRAFIKRQPAALVRLVLACEWALIPAVEMLMHARIALVGPLNPKYSAARRAASAAGTVAVCAAWVALARHSLLAAALYFLSNAAFLQFMAMHDAFQHTYTVSIASDASSYVPGPGPRTAQYEEENTYSNVLSTHHPWLNLLSLNFGFHNAHHRKPMTPWFRLPALHAQLYGPAVEATPQALPFRTLWGAWFAHRLKRVLEEDYGVVAKAGTDRAKAFVGSLGVSFLTV